MSTNLKTSKWFILHRQHGFNKWNLHGQTVIRLSPINQEMTFSKCTLCSLAFLMPRILQSYWNGINCTKEWTKCMLHETTVCHFNVNNYIPYTWLYDTDLCCLFIKLNDWVEAECHRFFSPQIAWYYEWWMTEIHTVRQEIRKSGGHMKKNLCCVTDGFWEMLGVVEGSNNFCLS